MVSLLASEMIQLDPFTLFKKLSSERLCDLTWCCVCVCYVPMNGYSEHTKPLGRLSLVPKSFFCQVHR